METPTFYRPQAAPGRWALFPSVLPTPGSGALPRRSRWLSAEKNRPVLFAPSPRFFFADLVLFGGSFSGDAVLFLALGLWASWRMAAPRAQSKQVLRVVLFWIALNFLARNWDRVS